jgi:hypothetical protein
MKKAGQWILNVLVLAFLAVLAIPGDGYAQQPVLERISLTERGDELGYVLRYHLTAPVDSFVVLQPEHNRVQMILFSETLQTVGFSPPDDQDVITDIEYIEKVDGVAFQFLIHEDISVEATAYRDVNLRDVLLSLAYSDSQDLTLIVSPLDELFQHPAVEPDEDPEPEEEIAADEEPEPEAPLEPPAEPESRLDHFMQERNPSALNRLNPGDPMELYLRTIHPMQEQRNAASWNLRPARVAWEHLQPGTDSHPWMEHPYFSEERMDEEPAGYRVYTPEIYFSNNNKRPMGQNDGALWQGRGNNYLMTMGVGVQYGPFIAVLRPQFVYSENREFELSADPQYPGLSPYAMALTNIDSPQRFGEEPLNRIDLGDSFAEVEYAGWTAGFSNQRMWTGPAVHNPLLFSTNAPGFLHGFIGTGTPREVSGGQIETRLFWGGLRESDYFDDNPENNLRFITGFVFSYSPDFVPGLHVGYARTSYSYFGDGLSASDLVMSFRRSPSVQDTEETDPENARFTKSSFFLRWAYPRIGFEVYTEWGRNDDRRPVREIFMEPELNRGYVLGVLQSIDVGNNSRIVINGEFTNLENSSVTAQYRDYNIWYTNDLIRQGFTHRGQVLGAGIGPGSSTQVATASFYNRYGMAGISLARIAYHNDRLFANREHYHSRLPRPWMTIRWIYEAEIRHGFHGILFLPGNFELQADLYTGNIENRQNRYERTDGGFGDDIYFDERNLHIAFTLRYNLGQFLR